MVVWMVIHVVSSGSTRQITSKVRRLVLALITQHLNLELSLQELGATKGKRTVMSSTKCFCSVSLTSRLQCLPAALFIIPGLSDYGERCIELSARDLKKFFSFLRTLVI